jgi:hypothetical protein
MPSPWTESSRALSLPARRTYKAAFPVVMLGRITTCGLCRCIPSMMGLPLAFLQRGSSPFMGTFIAYGFYFSTPRSFYVQPGF